MKPVFGGFETDNSVYLIISKFKGHRCESPMPVYRGRVASNYAFSPFKGIRIKVTARISLFFFLTIYNFYCGFSCKLICGYIIRKRKMSLYHCTWDYCLNRCLSEIYRFKLGFPAKRKNRFVNFLRIFFLRPFYFVSAFCFFVTNHDFLISISLQPNAVDLRYFKLWILLDERI